MVVGGCSWVRFWGALRGRPGLLFAGGPDPAMSDGPCRFSLVGFWVNGILREVLIKKFSDEMRISAFFDRERWVLIKKSSDGMRLSAYFKSAGFWVLFSDWLVCGWPDETEILTR